MQSMTIIHWLIVAGVVLLVFGVRKFLEIPIIGIRKTEAQRRWEWVGTPISLGWSIAVLVVGDSIRKGHVASQPLLLLGIAVVAALGVAMVWWMYRWLTKADEFIRRAETEALALGFGLSMVGLVVAGQLGSAGLGLDTRSMTPGMSYVMLLCLGYGIGRVIVYVRYR